MKRFTLMAGLLAATLSLGGCVVDDFDDDDYYDNSRRRSSGYYNNDYPRSDRIRSSSAYHECMGMPGRRDDYCYDQVRSGNYGWRRSQSQSHGDNIRSSGAYRECMSTPGRRDDYCYDQIRRGTYGWRR